MASFKDTFEANIFEANTFAAGVWRGTGVDPVIGDSSADFDPDLGETTFAALIAKLKNNIDIGFIYSGVINPFKVPYYSVSKISTVLDDLDTCLNRIERNIFQIDIYGKDPDQLKTASLDLENTLSFNQLVIGNRRFQGMWKLSSRLEEIVKGIFKNSFEYEVWTRREFTSYNKDTTVGTSFYNAIYQRYLSTIGLNLSGKLNGFILSRFTQVKRPYLFVPNYQSEEEFRNTCAITEGTEFSLSVEDNNPENVEVILEEIDKLYSYCKLKIDKTFLGLYWLGSSLDEFEPGLWRGSVRYKILLETNI